VFYVVVWIGPDRKWIFFNFEEHDYRVYSREIRDFFGFPTS
jgi:5-deoxy-D-glucuronate isomerase